MALGVKVSMLTCVFFIGGICWVVNNIAAPIARAPSVLAHSTAPLDTRLDSAPRGPRSDATTLVGRFEHFVPQTGEPEIDANRLVANLPNVDMRGASEAVPGLVARDDAWRPDDSAGAETAGPAHASLQAAPAAGVELDEPLVPQSSIAVASGDRTANAAQEATIIDAPAATVADVRDPPSQDPSAVTDRYEVRRGDTIALIARRALNSDEPRVIRALLDANPQLSKRENLLFVGEQLSLPKVAIDAASAAEAPRLAAATPTPRKVAEPTRSAAPKAKLSAAKSVASSSRWYTVRANDSLHHIARKTLKDANRWREIAEINGLKNANRLEEGRKLRLPKDDT